MSFRRSVLGLLSAGLGCLTAGAAQAETYQIDPVHSSVQFAIRHLVSRTTGRFTEVSGTIAYDPQDAAKSTVQAVIKTASINTQNEMRDNHLRTADFLEVEKYPEITFTSSKVEKQGDKLLVTGNLIMHGVTRTVKLPVEVLGVGTHPRNNAPVAGFAADITLKRSDYGVNSFVDKAGVLGDDVQVTLNIEAGAEPPK